MLGQTGPNWAKLGQTGPNWSPRPILLRQEYLDHLTEKVKIVSSLIQNIYSYQIYIFIPKTLSSWVSSSRDSFIRTRLFLKHKYGRAGQGEILHKLMTIINEFLAN